MDPGKIVKWLEDRAIETVLTLIAYREENGHPFRGTVDDVADLVGIRRTTFGLVLNTARSVAFVKKHGYVIPYVPKGPGPKDWFAIASHSIEDLEEIRQGEMIAKRDTTVRIRRILAQSEYRAPAFDARTRAGKREKDAMVQLEAALISLEQSSDGTS